jgi:hypothetical protein
MARHLSGFASWSAQALARFTDSAPTALYTIRHAGRKKNPIANIAYNPTSMIPSSQVEELSAMILRAMKTDRTIPTNSK